MIEENGRTGGSSETHKRGEREAMGTREEHRIGVERGLRRGMARTKTLEGAEDERESGGRRRAGREAERGRFAVDEK